MNYPIRSIEIKRFRGIEDLKIEEFSRINIFLGKNNVGKTSILEAIFLLTGMSNLTLPALVNSIREEGAIARENLSWLFYNRDINFPIVISNPPYRTLQIVPILELDDGRGAIPTNSVSGLKIDGLKSEFSDNGKKREVSFYKRNDELTLEKSDYEEKIVADYLPSNRLKANLTPNIETIIRKNRKDRLIEIIKQFDRKAINVEIINDNIYVQLENIDDLMPISFIGDGLQRFIGICAAVLNPNNNIVLIDEIDNGLHYTVIKQLWRSLIKLSIENDTQLFITTHNEESLKYLAAAVTGEDKNDVLSVFSVQMTKNAGLKAYKYTATALQGAVEKDIEIR